jgi:hypothetical protein
VLPLLLYLPAAFLKYLSSELINIRPSNLLDISLHISQSHDIIVSRTSRGGHGLPLRVRHKLCILEKQRRAVQRHTSSGPASASVTPTLDEHCQLVGAVEHGGRYLTRTGHCNGRPDLIHAGVSRQWFFFWLAVSWNWFIFINMPILNASPALRSRAVAYFLNIHLSAGFIGFFVSYGQQSIF